MTRLQLKLRKTACAALLSRPSAAQPQVKRNLREQLPPWTSAALAVQPHHLKGSRMQIGICSYSFHRIYAAGELDIFGYIDLCKELGCTQLDPWNAHLSILEDPRQTLSAGRKPGESQHLTVPPAEHIDQIREAADAAGIPFGTIAIDGAHIYEPTEAARRENRKRADGWMEAALRLGATQVRIDAGGPEEMPDEIFRIIVHGYRDLIDRARPKGIEILVENHWGPTL